MPRGKAKRKTSKKSAVKSRAGLRILGNHRHSYQGTMRPPVQYNRPHRKIFESKKVI